MKKETGHPSWVTQLGKLPDYRIARENRVSIRRVRALRRELGITRFGHGGWPREILELLGKVPDIQLAARFALRPEAIRIKRRSLGIALPRYNRWTEEVLGRLGKVPDAQIAADLKVSRMVVATKRRSLGISAPPAPKRLQNYQKAIYPLQLSKALGLAPDYELSARFGLRTEDVKAYRHSLGIRGFRRRSG